MTHKWRMEKQENSHPPLFFVNMHRKAEKNLTIYLFIQK